MQLSDIKKAPFGYRRDDVYKYFAELSGDFSERLKKTEEASEKRIDELTRKNEELEARLAEVSRQNEEYRAKEMAVADSIIGAKRYADSLMAESERMVEAQRSELKAQFLSAKNEAERVLSGVAACKAAVAKQLEMMLSDMSKTEKETLEEIKGAESAIETLEALAESDTLSLFHITKE